MGEAQRDKNYVTTLIGVSSVDGITPVTIYVDPVTHRILVSASVGALDDLSDVTITAVAKGDVFYYNGTAWVNLPPGTSGKFLKTQGAGANPIWDTPSTSAGGSDTQVQFNDGGTVIGGDAGFTYNKTTDVGTIGGLLVSGLTASQIVGTDASKNLVSLAVATYPSLTELSYIKGLSSAIQTQLDGKQASLGFTAENVANKSTDTALGTSDTLYPSQKAVKSYVDAVAQGLSVKGSVILATAVALPANTYLAGVITITATGTLTVDGTVTALNDRILVKDEVAGLKNGVYKVTTAGAIGVAAVLTRSTDMDLSAEFPGAFVFAETGTVNAAAGFVCTNSTNPNVGTDTISFTQFSGAGEITAGTGLTKTGNVIDAIGTADRITVGADAIDIASTYIGQSSITTVGTLISLAVGAITSTGLFTVSLAGVVGRFVNTTDNASVQVAKFEGDRATPTASDAAYISLILSDSAGNQDEQARITWSAPTITDGATQDGNLAFSVLRNGSLESAFTIFGSTGTITFGYKVSSALDITAGTLTATTNFLPDANDGAGLGVSGTAFSDLFLASGAVINFDAGASLITHSINTLTIGGSGATTLALGTNTLTLTGSIAATGARVTKGWFTDLESTNAPTVSGAAVYYVGGTDVAVADGGTGKSSWTQYLIPYADTTTSFSQIAIGTAGQVLTSNGAGAAPTFQAAAGGGTDLFSTSHYVDIIPFADGYWIETITATATITLDQFGIRLVASDTSGRAQIGVNRSQGPIGYNQNMSVRWRPTVIYIGTNSNVGRMYTMMNSGSLEAATAYVGYRVARAAGANTVLAVSKDATTEQTTDVTATFGINTTAGASVGTVLTCVLTANTNAKFYSQGTLLATNSTNYPLNSDTTSEVNAFGAKVDGTGGGGPEMTMLNSVLIKVDF